MFRAIIRTLHLTVFVFLEYVRSGRILADLMAMIVFYYLFFKVQWGGRMDAEHFFTLLGIYTLAISLYTMSATLSLGDRPQNYILLSRRLGRTGYLLGLYLNAVGIVFAHYMLLCIVTRFFTYVEDLNIITWAFGSIPLLLNVGLFSALLLLLSPMVFSTGWRLFVLSLFALAFSGNFFTGVAQSAMPPTLLNVLKSLQTILSWPLVPAFSGFALAVDREISLYAGIVIVAQFSLLVALLGLAFFSFSRRELMFGVE
jgi:hypothetical protein